MSVIEYKLYSIKSIYTCTHTLDLLHFLFIVGRPQIDYTVLQLKMNRTRIHSAALKASCTVRVEFFEMLCFGNKNQHFHGEYVREPHFFLVQTHLFLPMRLRHTD